MTTEIRPKLELVGATSLVIGTIIGSGIFITANFILQDVGSWGLALIVWLVSGLLAMCGALCWAEMSTILPRQGGTYIFIKEGLGDFPAFLYIITRVLLTNPCACAVQSLATARYLLAPLTDRCVPDLSVQLMASVLLLLISFLHCSSTQVTTHINTFVTSIKLLTLLTITATGFVVLGVSPPSLPPFFQGTSTSINAHVGAIYGGYWAYAGWQAIPSFIEDIKNPRRNVPLAIMLGLLTTTVVYVLLNFAFLCVLNMEEMKTSELVVSNFANKLGGVNLSAPLSLLVSLSLFGANIGMFLVSGRFCFAASREGHIPSFLSLLHVKSNTPVTAQIFNAVIAIIMISITTKIYILLKLFVFISLGFDVFVLLSFFRIRYKKDDFPEPTFKNPLFIPVGYTLFLAVLFIIPIVRDPDLMLLIPVGFLMIMSLLYLFFIKLEYAKLISFWKLDDLFCKLINLEKCKKDS